MLNDLKNLPFSHNNHLLISYDNINPDKDEINILKTSLQSYNNDYSKLLVEINLWKKKLEEKIFNLEKLIRKNEIINNIDFILNYNNFKVNYNNIMKFRSIYSEVISPEKAQKNNNILKVSSTKKTINMGNYNYHQHNIAKTLLNQLLFESDKTLENNSFLSNGIKIVKYLSDSYVKNGFISSKNISYPKISENFKKNLNITENIEPTRTLSCNKIIEKHIDLRKSKRQHSRIKLYPKLL